MVEPIDFEKSPQMLKVLSDYCRYCAKEHVKSGNFMAGPRRNSPAVCTNRNKLNSKAKADHLSKK